ncbi:right-handed parallel beta-helix repeat-containing protein [Shewanella sp. 10N.7]|uniref:right-handed parallel beta-helix repeat-containing protein n=1 Tax=Shewanella sp. 10N.7 TaxID=2885093 RepID=UPI001E5F1C72|nr:right-handed parallel beta-helix repeat-containing protein [Shewanella sp. 10N.7]MCC4831807.1 right-handed parallel beta-helix repeat-containing protein [Shewanella sp. 10N.7]
MANNNITRRQFIKLTGLAGLGVMATTSAMSFAMPTFNISLLPSSTDAEFYVAPNGNDKAVGTSTKQAFATLARARDAVRQYKIQFPDNNIVVLVRGGRYELDGTVVFGLEDSAIGKGSITYAAYPGETPVFSAAKEIKGWKKAPSDLADLPAAARGKVLVADVSDTFKTLYDDQGMLPRARTEGFIPNNKGKKNQVSFPKGAMRNWSNVKDAELFVRPHHAWIVNVLPLISVDERKLIAKTSVNATYAMNPLHFLKTTDNCFVENVIDGLKNPGNWVLDSKAGKVYLWPRDDSKVYAPKLQELVKVEGNVDVDGPKDTPVKNLNFIGLSFMHGERHTLVKGDAGIQHDWEMLDRDHAMFRLRGTENCTIANCHFAHCGGGALRVDLHGIENKITDNVMEYIGSTGILLCGYGPGTKDVNHRNIVRNNHVHHTGRIYSHGPGILVWQSGNNTVTNNLIHNTPYTGLIVSGFMSHFFAKGDNRELVRTVRWNEIGGSRRAMTRDQAMPYLHSKDNLIGYNEIHHAMEELGDGNAIYIRGAGKGNIIKANYVHHLVAPMIMQAAIRTDGGQTDTLITENIIYKCTSQGLLIKLNNRAINNYVIDIIAPPRGYYVSLREGPMTGGALKNNIFYSTKDNCRFVDELPAGEGRTSEDRRGRALAKAADGDTDNNIYYCAADMSIATKHLENHQKQNIDMNALATDPMFVDPANGNFALKPNSPAFKLGIEPIDMSRIGLQKA